jgi:hypothetical protein
LLSWTNIQTRRVVAELGEQVHLRLSVAGLVVVRTAIQCQASQCALALGSSSSRTSRTGLKLLGTKELATGGRFEEVCIGTHGAGGPGTRRAGTVIPGWHGGRTLILGHLVVDFTREFRTVGYAVATGTESTEVHVYFGLADHPRAHTGALDSVGIRIDVALAAEGDSVVHIHTETRWTGDLC